MALTSIADAIETTIAALGERLTDEHGALVALARSLAKAVDADPCADCGAATTAALWKEMRATITALSEVGADDLDDDTVAFRWSVQVPRRAEVGDPEES